MRHWMPQRYLTGFLASLEKKLSLYHGGFQLDTFFCLKFWIKSIVLTKGELQICTIETGLISYYTFKIRLFQNPFSEPFFRAHEFTTLTRIVFLESTESLKKKMLSHNKNSTVLQRQISLCIDVTFEVGKKY